MKNRWLLLWQLTPGQRLRYFAAFGLLPLGITASFAVPLIGRAALDSLLAGQPVVLPGWTAIRKSCDGSEVAQSLLLASSALLFFSLVSGAFNYLRERWSAVAAENAACRLRDRLYDHLQRLPCAWHDQADPGDVVQRCTSDVDKVRAFLGTQLMEIGHSISLLLAAGPLMIWMDWRLALVSLTVVPPIVLFSYFFFSRLHSAFQGEEEAEGALTAGLRENLTGIRVVRAFARQEHECAKFAVKNRTLRERTFRIYLLMAWFWSLSDFLCMAQAGLALLCGAWWVARGELSVGTLFAFIVLVNMFLWPVRMLGRILAETGRTGVALGRIAELLRAEQESGPVAGAVPTSAPEVGATDLEIERLSFGYAKGGEALRDLNLVIPVGQTLALLGPAGSGKSTLVQLLVRFYDYRDGAIRLGGRELRELPRAETRRRITAVLQDPFIFSRSLLENIRFGRRGALEDEVQRAAANAAIHETIAGFPQGYDTVAGERGVTLSGGQRQRLAIARALIRDSEVLILDDSLSAVDAETEAGILSALRARRGRSTTILIAHRLTTLAHADRIVVLEEGRISQDGTAAQLAQTPGLYQRLWRIQGNLDEDLRRELERNGSPATGA